MEDGLGALADLTALDDLIEVREAAEEAGSSSDTLAKIDDAIRAAGGGLGGGEAAVSDENTDLTSDQILATVEATLGKSVGEATPAEMAAVINALNRYARMGNAAANTLVNRFDTEEKAKKNPYIYQQYRDKAVEYASLKAIGAVTDYRYLYDGSKRVATLANGGVAYTFTSFKDMVGMNGGDSAELEKSVVFQAVPYISEADAQSYFQCSSEYINGTQDAVITPAGNQKIADDILSALTAG